MPDDNRKDPAAVRSQAPATKPKADTLSKIVDKINASDSILVALSDAPSVDELAAAVGLTMLLDRISKHATAIFSGEIPNALEFLKPEETLEKNTDSLRDFIIALNKEKADHIRYMIEGDFVRIYITPYRTTLDEKDLEFSYGDYNVDLVIAIDVKNSDDLDDALSEYGRIMHDAVTINITNGAPGRFAELEWSMPEASSVCEMIIGLAERLGVTDFDQDIATAFLTGIVSATERFSNSHTTPGSLTIASKLMSAGADQQLISSNVMKKADDNNSVGGSAGGAEDAKASEQADSATEVKPVIEIKMKPETKTSSEAVVGTGTTGLEAVASMAAESEAKEDLIPTPASVELPQAEPVSIPQPIAQAAPSPVLESTTKPAVTIPIPPAEPVRTEVNPAAQAAPTLPTPDIISLPQISYEQTQEPTQPLDQQIKPTIQLVPQPVAQPVVNTVPQTVAQPATKPAPQPAVQLAPEPTPLPTVQPAAPTTPPDYGAMIDAELAEANKPKLEPVPQPVIAQPAPEPAVQLAPEPTPLPPLPMPPAPQPFAEQVTPVPLVTPVVPSTPTTTTPVAPAGPAAPVEPSAPVEPAAPTTPTLPKPSTTPNNSAFQIPNLQ